MFDLSRQDHREFHDLCKQLLFFEPQSRLAASKAMEAREKAAIKSEVHQGRRSLMATTVATNFLHRGPNLNFMCATPPWPCDL